MTPLTTSRADTAARSLRHAATVILLREYAGEVQVLMTRRHANLSFMADMWVFPGGALHAADRSDAALSRLPDVATLSCAHLSSLQGDALEQRDCLALVVAACRETFEETGLLLARTMQGKECDAALVERLQSERATVAAQASTFADLLQREALQLDASRLIYWAHWITPSGAERRFDTRFFAIAAPTQQQATPDLNEASEMVWMSPSALLAQSASGSMRIAQPTLFNLHDLQASISAAASLPDMFSREATRRVTSILPKMVTQSARSVIVMPWDASYDDVPGDGWRCDCPERLRHLPSRVERPIAR